MESKPPKAVVPTPYGVYEIPVEDIVSISLGVENPDDRFVELRRTGFDHWEFRIVTTKLVAENVSLSLWWHLKNWWRIRKYSKRRIDIDPRRG